MVVIFSILKEIRLVIYNETHDIKIQIEPGNYTSGTLIETLSRAIENLKGNNEDDGYITENNPRINRRVTE